MDFPRPPRSTRKLLAANAAGCAELLANASHVDNGFAGNTFGPLAKRVLQRAYTRYFQDNCSPQIMKLSDQIAAEFPGDDPELLPGGQAWLGVCVDQQLRGCFVTRRTICAFDHPIALRRSGEEGILPALRSLALSGSFPEPVERKVEHTTVFVGDLLI